jgi:hypothetical protein
MPTAARTAVPRARVMSLEAMAQFLAALPAGLPERQDA